MHSFYSFDYVSGLPIKSLTRLLGKALEKKYENRAWDLYVAKYAWMTEEDFIPFEEFYKPHKEPIETKSEEEILAEVKDILDNFQRGG